MKQKNEIKYEMREKKSRFNDDEIVDLFLSVFSNSEGEEEARMVARLAKNLLSLTPQDDLYVFTVRDGEGLAGASIFSRLHNISNAA